MLNVCAMNITKVPTTKLEMMLAKLDESHPNYILAEAELERRDSLEDRTKMKQRQAKLDEALKLQALKSNIAEIFEGFRGKKTIILIEKLGQEFIADYTIDDDFVVYSHVAYKSYNLECNSRWECETKAKANQKVAGLLYDRIYNKFMREPTAEDLAFLKVVLGL